MAFASAKLRKPLFGSEQGISHNFRGIFHLNSLRQPASFPHPSRLPRRCSEQEAAGYKARSTNSVLYVPCFSRGASPLLDGSTFVVASACERSATQCIAASRHSSRSIPHRALVTRQSWKVNPVCSVAVSCQPHARVMPRNAPIATPNAKEWNRLTDVPSLPSGSLTSDRPGNGGMRLWKYNNANAAENEADRLAKGMEVKHVSYNTGFSGAKLVCASSSDPSSWSAIDKKVLLDESASMLHEMGGAMYTGCDMNTTTEDMDYLADQCPYVLAAIGNPGCNPNTATAYGVLGAVLAALDVDGKTLLVRRRAPLRAFTSVPPFILSHHSSPLSPCVSHTAGARMRQCRGYSCQRTREARGQRSDVRHRCLPCQSARLQEHK